MINVIDVVVAVLVLVQLLKCFGGPAKIIKGLLSLLCALIVFGVIARLLIEVPLPEPMRKTLEDSYFVKASHRMIKWIYPAIEKGAPTVDKFVKDKIISAPASKTSTISLPKITLPEKVLPDITLPEIK
jgi:hypothetical protein